MIEKLKKRMRELGLSPKRSLGQNFLIDERGISKMIQQAKATKNLWCLEIGPGLGALTDSLMDWGDSLVLMELDSVLAEYWRSQGLQVLECDALKYSWRGWSEGNVTLISNLPYQIASRLIVEISVQAPYIRDMVLMFQKEVAQRIGAYPGSPDYGFLSVVSQSFWNLKRVMDLAPSSFYPQPKVASRVLSFSRLCGRLQGESLREERPIRQMERFVGFVKCSFSQRRKLLVNNLLSLGLTQRMRPVKALEEMGWNVRVRAQELTPLQFMQLFKKVVG